MCLTFRIINRELLGQITMFSGYCNKKHTKLRKAFKLQEHCIHGLENNIKLDGKQGH